MQAKALDTQDKRTSEIAAAVQAGKADILRLWAAVERFAWQQALRWTRAMEGRAGVEENDLLQVAFIALMDTLPTWDVNKGEFLTLYGIKLKAEFTESCGQRTQRTRCDPINTVCRSMDEPIGDEDSDLTLADTISDEAAEDTLRTSNNGIFDRLCKRHLHNCRMHSATRSSVNSGSDESQTQS